MKNTLQFVDSCCSWVWTLHWAISTAGPKESRAWEIPIGATAPEVAGVIHTDFQKGLIKAEIVSFAD